MISFLLNERVVHLDDCPADMTVLQFLRTRAGLRGTKEGCASGDCGACTVVLAESEGEGLAYRSVNSCITFIGSLHGLQLLTVEHLAQADACDEEAALHPVQQAILSQHASQCGFCTPGFAMSMLALYKNCAAPTRATVTRGLAGNLCRCTGYRPIIDAALSLEPAADQFSATEAEVSKRLRGLLSATPLGSLSDQGRHFFVPTSSAELQQLVARYPQARLVAGGTDLALAVTQQLEAQDVLIYLGRVVELTLLSETEDALLIGAGVPYSQLEPLLHKHFPAFASLLERLGSTQIRNQGTLGGNIANASPVGDTPPVLLALNARLHVRSAAGRAVVAMDEFFTGYRQTALAPGGVIEQIEIPLVAAQKLSVFKVSKRLDDDISAVCGAFALTFEDGVVRSARLGFGGMAATPVRALQAEQALIGQPFSPAGIVAAQQALAQDFQPIDDVRASGRYRLHVAQNLLLRAVLEQDSGSQELLEVVHYA